MDMDIGMIINRKPIKDHIRMIRNVATVCSLGAKVFIMREISSMISDKVMAK